MSSVAVIGNCYLDEIYDIDTFPIPDTKIVASGLRLVLGGSATNTSVGLVALGLDAYLFTVMGDDEDAYRLFKEVRNKGIKSFYINHISGQSGRTIILLDKNKSSTKIGYQGVCSDMRKTLMFEGLSNPIFEHVHLSSVRIDMVRKALQYKKDRTFSLDFGAKTLQSSPDEILEVVNQLDLVFLNRAIFDNLYNVPLTDLNTLEVNCDLIVTAGTDGMYGLINGTTYHQPIIPVKEVIDTTGAGDAVSAAIIFGYLKNYNPQKILEIGVNAASKKIQSYGGSNGHASLNDLKDIL